MRFGLNIMPSLSACIVVRASLIVFYEKVVVQILDLELTTETRLNHSILY